MSSSKGSSAKGKAGSSSKGASPAKTSSSSKASTKSSSTKGPATKLPAAKPPVSKPAAGKPAPKALVTPPKGKVVKPPALKALTSKLKSARGIPEKGKGTPGVALGSKLQDSGASELPSKSLTSTSLTSTAKASTAKGFMSKSSEAKAGVESKSAARSISGIPVGHHVASSGMRDASERETPRKREESPLKKKDLDMFTELLNEEKRKILRHLEEVSASSEQQLDTTTASGDAADIAALEMTQANLQKIGKREAYLLKKIDLALEKITEGTYGECEMCGETIAIARLKARPVAQLCIDCKTAQEAEERKFSSRDRSGDAEEEVSEESEEM